MKTYMELQIEIVCFEMQDVITMSGFDGAMDSSGFGDPNFN